ncbi:MAG: D-alanine--D-alanine ligase A [Candidatus Aminicenantes bacterium RBG_13_62_12]|nr:MAG: D-alanine--D-alanine ligase A [Candidatus Aminicenantes bacterium RBG_13_62_12]
MNRKKIVVGLLFGGRSAEHKVSCDSAAAVYQNLDRLKFKPICIYINKKGDFRTVDSPLLRSAELNSGRYQSFLPWREGFSRTGLKADIYFPVLHGPYGEDGTIQGLLELADVPYVGAGVAASALGMDKALMKALFKSAGLPQVKYEVLREQEWRTGRKAVLARIRSSLRLPLFVKPANLGSSVGITKVKTWRRMEAAVQTALRYDRKVLVEQGISGRELECSVLGNDDPSASLPGEIVPFREFYDYEDKYLLGKTQLIAPAVLPTDTVREVRHLSLAAFKAVDGAGMARVDFFLERASNRLYVSEINTIPGFTEISMYPRLWEQSGLPFPRLLDRLILLGFERHDSKKRCLERKSR